MHGNRLIAGCLLAFICSCAGADRSSPSGSDSDGWQYGVSVGDDVSRVHALLGFAARAQDTGNGLLEEYPLSGVSVWLDRDRRVVRLNFVGPAGAYRYSRSFDWVVSDRELLFGVTAQMDESTFRSMLGTPIIDRIEGASVDVWLGRGAVRERRCVWRKNGLVIDALFVSESEAFIRHKKGSLIWLDLSRGL